MSPRRNGPSGWPATLRDGAVVVRPLRLRDGPAWVELRERNTSWLAPWEATPVGRTVAPPTLSTFVAYVLEQRKLGKVGEAMPFGVEFDGKLVGQVSVANITRGSAHTGAIGYWIDQAHAGRGITPTAVALVADHCFGAAQLHRVEINVRPENTASIRVVRKLAFREEGVRRGFLYVAGAYRDHLAFALLRDDLGAAGVLATWRRTDAAARGEH